MEKIHFLGFDFWNASGEEEVVSALIGPEAGDLFTKDNVNFLITPNAYDIAQYHTKYKDIYSFFRQAGVVLADGMPIVWLSRLRKRSLRKRIPGSDLFPVLWSAIRETRKKAFFILSNRELGERLIAEYPLAQYVVPELFNENDDAYIASFVRQHIAAVKALQPEFIFIGITLPKQQKLAMQLYGELSGSVKFNCLISILGASFEFYSGAKKRAPAFFRKTGLEWLYRFCQEPKRTWRRYTIGSLVFLGVALRELLGFSGTARKRGSDGADNGGNDNDGIGPK
jgi:N-acetylglucosaminyldiphosphoundecaprenol N-acetyl-beta-D-mannosaminyltransferase